MGGPNPEERRPEGDDRGGTAEEEDNGARPSSSASVERDEASKKEIDGEEKATTTPADREDSHAEHAAQDGDSPPRFKGVTKWFNSQKGRQRGAERVLPRNARGRRRGRI